MALYWRWPLLLSLTLVLSFTASSNSFGQDTAALDDAALDDNVWHYQVRPGDNIWSISRRLLTDWKRWPDIQAGNNIERPRAIPPGTRLAIPRKWLRRKPGPAMVSSVSGKAYVTDTERHPLDTGTTIEAGAVIETAPQATVQLTFVDGSKVTLHENARVVLEKLDTYEGTEAADVLIRLESGRLDADVQRKPENDSRFNFQSPALISAIRGTKIRTSLLGDGNRGTTEVLTGKVIVEAADRSLAVDKGYGTAADIGKEPEPPTALPEPPVPITDDGPQRQLPVRIAFEPVDGAASYRVRVVPAANPLATLVDVTGVEPVFGIEVLDDGDYQVMARAITSGGIEGYDASWPLEVDARPLAPRPIAPPEDRILRDDRTELRWDPADGASAYRLQSSLSPNFEVLELDVDGIAGESFPVEGLSEGTFYWRVAGIDDQGGPVPFSAIRRVAFEEPPPPPDPRTVRFDEEDHRLRLNLPNTDRTFRYQIARDGAFRDVVRDETVDEPVISLAGLIPDTYHVRMLAYEQDGYSSGFGPSREVEVQRWPYWALLALLALLALI